MNPPQRGYVQAVRTLAIASVTGAASALIAALFRLLLNVATEWVGSLGPRLSLAAPFAAALLVGLLILRKYPYTGGEGVQYYITAVNLRGGRLSPAATLLKLPATIVTLAAFGSGGTVGPLARMGAGAGSWLTGRTVGKTPLRREDDLAVGAICGVAGAFSAIFHSPLAAGLYATEVLRRESIRYTYLIGALLASVSAYVTSRIILGETPFFIIDAPRLELSAVETVWLPVTALLGGLTGLLYIFAIERLTSLFKRIPGGQPLKALTAAAVMSLSLYLGLGWALGTSPGLYNGLASGDIGAISEATSMTLGHLMPFAAILLLKIALTSITVGCGMSAGLTGPLVIMGMTLGAMTGAASGAVPAGPAYYGLMACGTAALISATLNVPLAAIALTLSLFGTSYILPAVTGSTISFFIFKGHTIYHYFGGPKTEPPESAMHRGTNGNDG